MLHTSYIELKKEALQSNLDFLREKAGKDTRYSMVIKSNAYGHGIEELVPVVEKMGVDHFSVFSVAEAQRVKSVKQEHCGLMIMGFVDDDYLEWTIENDISFYVFTPHRLKATVEVASKCKKPARIHLELETGMHRTGLLEKQLPEVVDILKENEGVIKVEGLCSHLAGAESIVNHNRIVSQIEKFKTMCHDLAKQGIKPRYRHLACSAGLLNYPDSRLDLVRVGISNYGFWPTQETRMRHLVNGDMKKDPLHRVLNWKSKIMSVSPVEEGEFVSYGKNFKMNRNGQIAVIPVGYGYGFSRTLSNNGYVLVGGRRVPVIGTVNMNMIVIDVTDVPDIKVNDEVVMIGQQGDETISVSSFSDMNNSMNYELLTRLPDHIPRQVV